MDLHMQPLRLVQCWHQLQLHQDEIQNGIGKPKSPAASCLQQ